jgi:hypothetical protein
MESVRTVYVPVVVYIPVPTTELDRKSDGNIVIGKHKSPRKVKKIGHLKIHDQKRKSTETKKSRTVTTEEKSTLTVEATSKYYQTAFISNPCEQFFGPQTIDLKGDYAESVVVVEKATTKTTVVEHVEYIPTPKWSKSQIVTLEELYRKSRFPKANEIKIIAQQLKVMDNDAEEWFRKRRGRDRKTRRKNDNLKSLIDNYLDL